jgi:hypothetical protein
MRTSNSCKVNMCFKITTLSIREVVSGSVDGSSSSQSASLLQKESAMSQEDLYTVLTCSTSVYVR